MLRHRRLFVDAVAPQAELFVIRYSGLGVRFSQVLFEFYFFWFGATWKTITCLIFCPLHDAQCLPGANACDTARQIAC